MVCWDLTPYGLMGSYEHLGGTHSLDLHESYPGMEQAVYHWD